MPAEENANTTGQSSADKEGAKGTSPTDRLRRAIATDGEIAPGELSSILEELAAATPDTARAALFDAARTGGTKAVPVLESAAVTLDPQRAVAAVAALATVRHPAAAEALARLAEAELPKVLRKEVRRALHRLRGSGVRIGEPAAVPRAPTLAEARQRVLAARVGNVDATGDRLVTLAVEAGMGGARLVVAIVSDEAGIRQFHGMEVGRSQLPERLAELNPNRESYHMVDAPPDYVRYVLWEAHDLNRTVSHPVPNEFYRWRAVIGERPAPPEREPVYDEIDPATIRWSPQLLDESGGILGLPELRGWLLPKELSAKVAQELARLRRAHIILPGQSQDGAEWRAIGQLVTAYFTPEMRLRYKRRLEQTAYVLAKLGRVLDARRAVAAALALDPRSPTPLARQPFPAEMVKLAMLASEYESEEKRVRSGGIILP